MEQELLTKKNLEVKVPAGIDSGVRLRVGGEGEAVAGGENGDLYVFISVKDSEDFERDGADVYVNYSIDAVQAALGCKVEIKTLDDTKETLNIPAGTQHGERFRLKAPGITRLKGHGHGAFFVRVLTHVPKKLSKEQRQHLEAYAATANLPFGDKVQKKRCASSFFKGSSSNSLSNPGIGYRIFTTPIS